MTITSYTDVNTTALGDYYSDRAAKGSHSHWSPYDLKLEGSRYHGLDVIVSAVPFDAESAEIAAMEIEAFGHGYGWGQADSYLADLGRSSNNDGDASEDDESLIDIYREQLFDSYADTEYFNYVFKSEARLKEAAATPEAFDFVRGLASRVMIAFEKGRDRCVEASETPQTPSP